MKIHVRQLGSLPKQFYKHIDNEPNNYKGSKHKKRISDIWAFELIRHEIKNHGNSSNI